MPVTSTGTSSDVFRAGVIGLVGACFFDPFGDAIGVAAQRLEGHELLTLEVGLRLGSVSFGGGTDGTGLAEGAGGVGTVSARGCGGLTRGVSGGT